jgi:hypothetical protein
MSKFNAMSSVFTWIYVVGIMRLKKSNIGAWALNIKLMHSITAHKKHAMPFERDELFFGISGLSLSVAFCGRGGISI